jgi:hypothetical protein
MYACNPVVHNIVCHQSHLLNTLQVELLSWMGNSVYVKCKQRRTEHVYNASHFSYFGVSRSATVVVAYIMKKYELSFEDALER